MPNSLLDALPSITLDNRREAVCIRVDVCDARVSGTALMPAPTKLEIGNCAC